MSKQILIICRGQSIGCSEKRTLITTNDNAPDIIKGEWICPKCEKRLTELQARKQFEEEKKQEQINNPGKCLTCSVKIKNGQICKSCLGKKIKEGFQQSQETSERLNELWEKTEENHIRTRDALLDLLASLEKKDTNQDNSKVEEIEEQIRQNQADIARTKQEIEENNKRSDSNNNNPVPSSIPLSNFNQPNNPPPTQTPNNQTNSKCYNCKKNFNQGENTNYLPQILDKKWCDACDPEVKVCFQATQQIFAGQTVDVDQLNISQENKVELLVITKLKNGESVDIDQLELDQESKAGLKEIQSQFEQGKIPTNKTPNEGYKYNSVCLDCKKEFSYKWKAPSQCQACHSKKIKVYDAQGFLQVISPQPFYAKGSFWIWTAITITCLIGMIYQTARWKKAKRAGKKYNWWTNKIS